MNQLPIVLIKHPIALVSMHKIITLGLIAVNVLFIPSLPSALAQSHSSTTETTKCATALQTAKNKITKGGNVKIVELSKKKEVPITYREYPKKRPFIYAFGLSGSGTNSILNSPNLMLSISREIIKNCPSVSIVDFGVYPSDFFRYFGLIGETKVEEFRCIDNYNQTKYPWGYVWCS